MKILGMGNAIVDVICKVDDDFLTKNTKSIQLWDIDLGPTAIKESNSTITPQNTKIIDCNNTLDLQESNFPYSQIRCHTSYSLLQSTISVKKLVEKVSSIGMSSVGITDYGNLFGAFEFVSICYENNIKPILGCEFYLVDDRKKRQFTLQKKDKRFSQVLYAKNKNGYQNLCKISSYGYIDGLYSGFPRVDKALIQQYKDDLIATTSGIYGEIAQLLINGQSTQAKECFLWWYNEFKDDFFIEIIY